MQKYKVIILSVFIGLGVFTQAYSAPTNEMSLVQIDSRDYGETNFVTKAIELERNPKTSLVKIIPDRRSSSVGSSMFVMIAFYEIAKARNTEYFVNLKDWIDAQGNWIYVGGFTNTKDVDIKKEFGQNYSDTDASGDRREGMSVSRVKMLFDKKMAVGSTNSSGKR